VPPPLTLTFTPTKQDYVKTLRAYYFRQRGTWIMLLVFSGVFVYGIYTILTSGFDRYPPYFYYLPLLFVIYLLFIFFYSPSLIGRRVQNDERLRATATWQVNARQIVIKNRHSLTKLDWSQFQRVIATRNYYLFVYAANRNTIQFLPRRAFASPEQEESFRDMLRKKFPGFK
jgi:hypothetical protein